jgi:hypothetical protein
MLEYIDKKLPFAIPTPTSTDLLPATDGTRQPVSRGTGLDKWTIGNDAAKINLHARTAQAAVLLSHVIYRVSSSGPEISSCGAGLLDKNLQSFAMDLLQPDGKHHNCWPYSICLR